MVYSGWLWSDLAFSTLIFIHACALLYKTLYNALQPCSFLASFTNSSSFCLALSLIHPTLLFSRSFIEELLRGMPTSILSKKVSLAFVLFGIASSVSSGITALGDSLIYLIPTDLC